MRARHVAWILLALLAGCNAPSNDVYVSAAAGTQVGIVLGADSTGAACVEQLRQGGTTALIYCGGEQHPSARIVMAKGGGSPDQLAVSSPWRAALNERLRCEPPVETTLFGQPAVTLQCIHRIEGFAHLGLVTVIGGKTYFGDADPSALAPLQRGIAVASGEVSAGSVTTLPIAPGLAALREKNEAISSHDIHEYRDLMTAGVRANLTDDFAAAEAAFRQAAALQKPDNPARADPLMHQALQLSNMEQYARADAVFREATEALDKARSDGKSLPDPVLAPELALYKALDQLNQGHATKALPLLDQAQAGYEAIIPANERKVGGPVIDAPTGGLEAMVAALADEQLFQDPTVAAAILGLITTRRARAVADLSLHNLDASAAEAQAAADLASQHGLAQAVVEARIFRTSAVIDAAQGKTERSLALLERANTAFRQSFPGSRPLAETELLRASALLRHGSIAEGARACRDAVGVLRRLDDGGVSTGLMMPCLDIFAASGSAAPNAAAGQDEYAQMFAAAQLAQSGVTSQQIAEAAALLAETQRNSKAGEAIRRRRQANAALDALYRERDLMAVRQEGGQPVSRGEVVALNAAISKAEVNQENADAAVRHDAPNYGQLVQEVVTAKQVFARLHHGEALADIVLGADHGWTILLRHGDIAVSRVAGGLPRMQKLVARIRASMATQPKELPPPFDAAAAQEIYAATLGGSAALLHGTTALVVAPSGPLLSIPFGLLLSGPAGNDLATAPWLATEMTIAHVPAPANFVSLRKIANGSPAPLPWIGFGDPIIPTQKQATASFPEGSCANAAASLAGLGTLTGAKAELDQVRAELGGSAQDEHIGADFTLDSVRKAPLKEYRVLEFATHGLLPTDLACQHQAALLTSPPPNAPDASQALLTASRIARLPLDADTVILSACNTSGPDGRSSGESLSGLARAFFYAGARSLLVTHWAVNDSVIRVLVAGTMQRYAQDPDAGLGAALAGEQRNLLHQAQANSGMAPLAHPFYWAPLALIGDAGGEKTRTAGSRSTLAGL